MRQHGRDLIAARAIPVDVGNSPELGDFPQETPYFQQVTPVQAEPALGVSRGLAQGKPAPIPGLQEVLAEGVLGEVDETVSLAQQLVRRPTVRLELVARMAGIEEVEEVVDEMGEVRQRFGTEVVELEIVATAR
jgi:hypothetical protein